jgi:hypothetical protein
MLDKITADEAYRMGIVTTLALRVGVEGLTRACNRARAPIRARTISPSGSSVFRRKRCQAFYENVLRAIYVFPYLLVAIAGLIFVLVRYQRHPEDRRRADLFFVECLFGPFPAIAVEWTIHELCC